MSIDPASLNDIKNALKTMGKDEMQELVLRLARHKKENKELLSYVLFLEENQRQFIADLKHELDTAFKGLHSGTAYLSMKGLRKILKWLNKFIKFSGNRETEAELVIYFCTKIMESEVRLHSSVVLANLYNRQVERAYRVIEYLQEDKRADFRADMDKLSAY